MNKQLRDLIEGCVNRKAAHLIDLVVRGVHARPVLEVYIDSENGVTTDVCTAVSREIAEALKANQLVPRDYTLTVSSPGIDRPLRFPWQYAKHVGRTLRVKTRNAEQAEEVHGVCKAADNTGVTIETKNGPIVLAYDLITEAKVKAPW